MSKSFLIARERRWIHDTELQGTTFWLEEPKKQKPSRKVLVFFCQLPPDDPDLFNPHISCFGQSQNFIYWPKILPEYDNYFCRNHTNESRTNQIGSIYHIEASTGLLQLLKVNYAQMAFSLKKKLPTAGCPNDLC